MENTPLLPLFFSPSRLILALLTSFCSGIAATLAQRSAACRGALRPNLRGQRLALSEVEGCPRASRQGLP